MQLHQADFHPQRFLVLDIHRVFLYRDARGGVGHLGEGGAGGRGGEGEVSGVQGEVFRYQSREEDDEGAVLSTDTIQ